MKKISKVCIFIAIICLGIFLLTKKDTQITQIGVIAPLTGIVAAFGEDIHRGVLGAQIKEPIIFEDDACESSKAVSAFHKLVDIDKVKIIIGPACGSPQEAIIPILKDKDVIVLSPSAASQDLYGKSDGKFFNMQYSLQSEANFLAKTVFERKHENIVLIVYRNAFSETVADSFKKSFKGKIIKEIVFTESTSDITTEISKLKGIDFDAVVSTDISFFFAQGTQKLLQYEINKPIYSLYATELPIVRPLVEGVFYSFPSALNGNNGATYELSQDAAKLAHEAINSCGDKTACIKDYLVNINIFDEYGTSNRPLVLKQIKEGNPIIVE